MTSLPYCEHVKEDQPEHEAGDYFGRHLYALMNWQLGRMIDGQQSYGCRIATRKLADIAIRELIHASAAMREHAEAADDGSEKAAPPMQASEYPELANQIEALLDYEHMREYYADDLKHREILQNVLARFDVAVRDARRAYSARVAVRPSDVVQFPGNHKP